ncbi:hypothetical protein [Herbaspirillum huttiense]|uniref:hypothetical protein n=1 Tax=Herbaspirillum huttiense TaxID=863372 RepID=UPI003B3B3DE7
MKERPILFSAPMVRAILAGDKTQTRRIAKDVRHPDLGNVYAPGALVLEREPQHVIDRACPYGRPGDRLWVRETWQYADWTEEGEPHIGYAADGERILIEEYPEEWGKRLEEVWCELSAPKNYDIDNRAADRRWRPNIHMPRWACRILLEITGVRVERLQDISEAGCWAEGIEEIDGSLDDLKIVEMAKRMGRCVDDVAPTFAALWESISGPGSWDANPWVWVIEFRRVK